MIYWKLHKQSQKRSSIRAYRSEQISAQELETILFAGSAAPVGRGNYAGLHITVI
ncbi:MAG: hypothetical protein GX786_11055 [Clostridiales bacterium]|nr:hypothetical protein [Clostridiales bacterium]